MNNTIVEIKGPLDDCYLVSGFCNYSLINELQRFILRNSPCMIGVTQSFTPPSKHICTASYGSHFTFMMGMKPTDKQIVYLQSIIDGYTDLTYEKLNNN